MCYFLPLCLRNVPSSRIPQLIWYFLCFPAMNRLRCRSLLIAVATLLSSFKTSTCSSSTRCDHFVEISNSSKLIKKLKWFRNKRQYELTFLSELLTNWSHPAFWASRLNKRDKGFANLLPRRQLEEAVRSNIRQPKLMEITKFSDLLGITRPSSTNRYDH